VRRVRFVPATVAAFAVLILAGPAAAADRIGVRVDRTAISTALGHKFVFRSTVTNRGDTAARNLIAHLNVLSFRDGVYIDPEDWSSHRTRYLPPIPAGGSITLTWRLQAVNAGSIGIYVAVLPQTGAEAQPPTPGPTIRVSVAHRQTLNSGGILPLALGIPALLGLMTVGLRLRRRRPA
jgi:hypothetical protein